MTSSPRLSSRWAVPYIRPHFPDAADVAEDLAVISANNWYTNFGPFEREFTERLTGYAGGTRHVATVNNATSGLLGALSVLLPDARRRPGLVLVASFTFAAGPAAIHWVGHRPLFVDVDPVTTQPSLPDARAALDRHGDGVVGILLTNSFGIGNPEVEAWEELARERGLPLVVDSAAGFGSRYPSGRLVGDAGDCEVFSFHATKPFAIGEGGAVFCATAETAERIRSFTNFGFTDHDATMFGINGKLQEINAAIGLRRLEAYDEELEDRRRTLAWLRQVFEERGFALLPHQELSSVSALFVTGDDATRRDAMLAALHDAGVEARVYYEPAVHRQAAFADDARVSDLAATDDVCRRIIAVPVHPRMRQEDLELIRAAAADS